MAPVADAASTSFREMDMCVRARARAPLYCSVTTDVITHLCLRPCGQSTTELTAAGLLTLGGPMVGAPRDGFRFAWILSLYWVVLWTSDVRFAHLPPVLEPDMASASEPRGSREINFPCC